MPKSVTQYHRTIGYKFVKRFVRCVNGINSEYFQPEVSLPFQEGDFGVCSSEDDFLIHGKYWFVVTRQKDLKSHRVPAENFAIVSCSEVGDETC